MLEGIRVLRREGDALADIFPNTHRSSFFDLNINTVPWGMVAFLLLQDVAPRGGITWGSNRGPSQSRMSQTCGRSAPWMTPFLTFKERTEKGERNFPVFLPPPPKHDFLMKPVWVGFYSVEVTLVRWGQRSGIGSERFRGCVLAPTVPSLTHSLNTALEEM